MGDSFRAAGRVQVRGGSATAGRWRRRPPRSGSAGAPAPGRPPTRYVPQSPARWPAVITW